MFVYRLEYDGLGIYGSQILRDIGLDLDYYFNAEHCPEPETDEILKDMFVKKFNSIKHYFGFSSVEQLQRWFYKARHREIFMREGVKLVVYEVSSEYVFEGASQVFFEMDKAKKIECNIDWVNPIGEQHDYA